MKEDVTHPEAYLKSLQVSGGFRVPEGYLEGLDVWLEGVCSEITATEFVNAEKTWKVPEEYFTQLEKRILDRVPQSPPRKHQTVYFNLWVSISGIAAALILVTGMFFSLPNQVNPEIVNSRLMVDEVAQHLLNSDIDVDLLCDAGWCNELDQLDYHTLDRELEDYLLDSGNTYLMDEI